MSMHPHGRTQHCAVLVVAAWLCAGVSGEAGWDEPNIILEGNPQHWEKIPQARPTDPKPFPPLGKLWKKKSTSIVVLVAALRETRCGSTLHNLFSKAQYPKRVFFAVVQQNEESDEDCLEGTPTTLSNPHPRAEPCPPQRIAS